MAGAKENMRSQADEGGLRKLSVANLSLMGFLKTNLVSGRGNLFAGDESCACEIPGDVNNDCLATPFDAEAITYFMATAKKHGNRFSILTTLGCK